MDVDDNPLVKVVFGADGGFGSTIETPWAKPVGVNVYELDNLPLFAYGISWGDIFEASPEPDDPRPHFRRVLRKSGNRTLRVVLKPPADVSAGSMAVLTRLNEMGCAHEGANHSYIAVSVPPGVDLKAVCEFLRGTGHRWEHADPTLEQVRRSG